MDYLELSERIKLCSGGLNSGTVVSEHHSSLDRLQQVRDQLESHRFRHAAAEAIFSILTLCLYKQ